MLDGSLTEMKAANDNHDNHNNHDNDDNDENIKSVAEEWGILVFSCVPKEHKKTFAPEKWELL